MEEKVCSSHPQGGLWPLSNSRQGQLLPLASLSTLITSCTTSTPLLRSEDTFWASSLLRNPNARGGTRRSEHQLQGTPDWRPNHKLLRVQRPPIHAWAPLQALGTSSTASSFPFPCPRRQLPLLKVPNLRELLHPFCSCRFPIPA